jgi:hypothetical protein
MISGEKKKIASRTGEKGKEEAEEEEKESQDGVMQNTSRNPKRNMKNHHFPLPLSLFLYMNSAYVHICVCEMIMDES